MDADTELVELFYKHCPSAKSSEDVVTEIIQTVDCHTLTVCLSALSLAASGMEPEELLAELKTCGLNISSGEDVELYKDNDFTDGLMIEHLRKLLQLGKLSNQQLDILRNLSLLSVTDVLKNSFKNWMKLDNLTDVNHLIKYGFINEDTDNKKISLHPLLQEVIAIETVPTVTTCRTMLDNLHLICLAHGLELRRPKNIISSLISVAEICMWMMVPISCCSYRICSLIWTNIWYQITCQSLPKESAMLWTNTSWSLLVTRHYYWIIRQNVFC